MSVKRFPKVAVITDVSTKFVTDNTKRPHQLSQNQVGFFKVDQFEIIGTGTGATPGATLNSLQIHQNIGDNKFGTVRSKTIDRNKVRGYYGLTAAAGQTSIRYIGYDEVDNTKDIAVVCGSEFVIHVRITDNRLVQWYGANNNPGYRKSIVVNTGCCPAGQPNAIADRDAMADYLVAEINGLNHPPNDYPSGTELPDFVIATKVTTGTQGTSNYRVGVKIETIPAPIQLIENCNPIKFHEVNLTQVEVAFDGGRLCNFNVPITNFREAKPGNGFPNEVVALEAESQGYDRVPEVYEQPMYMKLNNFIILAQDGKKYDFIFLNYDWTHDTSSSGAAPQQITEKYQHVLIAETGTLQPVADVLNSWLTGLYPTVTL